MGGRIGAQKTIENHSNWYENAINFIHLFSGFFDRNVTDFGVREYKRVFRHSGIKTAEGSTRFVIMGSDWVIKFDVIHDDYKLEEFGNNKSEWENYQKAKRAGFGYLFAPMKLYTYNNMIWYVYKRIHCVGTASEGYISDYLTEEETAFLDELTSDLWENNFGFENGYPVIIDWAAEKQSI